MLSFLAKVYQLWQQNLLAFNEVGFRNGLRPEDPVVQQIVRHEDKSDTSTD